MIALLAAVAFVEFVGLLALGVVYVGVEDELSATHLEVEVLKASAAGRTGHAGPPPNPFRPLRSVSPVDVPKAGDPE